jgi:hypothetical protein
MYGFKNVGIWYHVLGGVGAGYLGKKLKINPWITLGIVSAVAIGWEIYEYPENRKIFGNHTDWLLMDSGGDIISSIGFCVVISL